MTNTNKSDFFITEDGDIELRRTYLSFDNKEPDVPLLENRNIKLIHGRESLLQTIRIRLISSDPDVPDVKAKDFCANLEDLIGLPNTVETAKLGVEMITRALTFDKLVSYEDLYVRPVPLNQSTITFFVLVKDDNTVISFEALLNLEEGVTIGRVNYDSVS